MYDMGNQIYNLPAVSFPVTITGKTGADGIKYTGASVAEPINRSITLHGDTTFENLTIFADSGYTHNIIVANGYKLVMGEGVNSICREGKSYYFTIYGGAYNEGDVVESTDVTIRSGTWRAVYAGGYNSIVSGTAKLDISGATVYDSIYASRMGNVVRVEMNISNTTLTTGSIYAGSQTANSPKKLGYVENGVTITLGENVTAANLYCSAKTYGSITGGVTVVADGVDFTKLPLVARYPSLSASYSTDWIQVKLARDMKTDMTLDPSMVLDLNGYDVTGAITVDDTLKVKDSRTDDFTVDDGIYGEITGTVNGTVEAADGYATLDNKSFHKLSQRISTVALRPYATGIYYGATWQCDEVLAESIQNYGIALSADDMPDEGFAADSKTLYTQLDGSTFVSGKAANSVLVANILKPDAEDNNGRGQRDIHALSYVTFEGGKTYVSDGISYSLCDVMHLLDQNAYEENATKLNAFYTTWKTTMEAWGFTNIGK